MTHIRCAKKRWLSLFLLYVAVLLIGVSFLFVKHAFAFGTFSGLAQQELQGAVQETTCGAAPISPPCFGKAIKDVAEVLQNRIIDPAFTTALVQGLLNLSQFVVNRLAYEAALVVANGGPGQGSLFYEKSAAEGFKEFGKDVAGKAVDELNDVTSSKLGVKFDFCSPGDLFNLSLALGIKQKYQPEKPKCDIDEFLDNWEAFAVDAYTTATDPDVAKAAVISKFAESLKPGRNELSAAIKFNLAVQQEVDTQQQLEKEMRLFNAFKDVKDPVTGQTKTPNKIVEDDFLATLSNVVRGESTKLTASDALSFGTAAGGLAMTAASTFTNTLLSQLFNKIYKGLFDTSDETSVDPFNVEAIATTTQNPEVLSKVFAATPVAQLNYNALSEFVVCPPQGIANRGLNNCVMDSNFLTAVTRGTSGVPMTVQEAIDEGLLNGNWQLISPESASINQDPLCYTFAFCYANLVKLRKARVLPIGWELAALRNKTAKRTLQQIIDEFDTCNQYGTIDAQHPFCHFIDPNWVLKYPDTQCRATATSEIRLTSQSPGRQSYCADAPSCLGENSDGSCTDGYGYCVQEKNVWRFQGDECPSYYAGCLSLTSTSATNNQKQDLLIHTVDYSVCNQQNAGCGWYRTVKEPVADGLYDWLGSGTSTYYTGSDDSFAFKFQQKDGSVANPSALSYAYAERTYFTRAAQTCSESDAGCSELVPADPVTLNLLRNPSFEQDEQKDGVPDHWFLSGDLTSSQVSLAITPGIRGVQALKFLSDGSSTMGITQFVSGQPNQFYTLSYYAIIDTTDLIKQEIRAFDAKGNALSFKGLSAYGCEVSTNAGVSVILSSKTAVKEWKRFSCTFNAPAQTSQLQVRLAYKDGLTYDAVQLEPQSVMSDFVEGLSANKQTAKFIKVAPEYLNCTGNLTDSPLCVDYAQMCQAQDVGCTLYTPEDGDPSLPAITSPLDYCPSECVGYTTFKQEQTLYEPEKFPLHFIPTQAKACAVQDVGCDGFTNLSAASEGGENVEYYTRMRACATPEMASGPAQNKQSAVFYTWEGSDNAGYQLRSWNLLESNFSDTATMTLTFSGFSEQRIGKAPCSNWVVSATDELICQDTASGHQNSLELDFTCDEHADILSNPDCREFYDTDGFVHYRKFPDTVTVSGQCQPYRKNESTLTDCYASGGYWDAQVGFCRYFGLASESHVCSDTANGCRSYTGGAGRNSVTLLSETFENGTYQGFMPWGSISGSPIISNESLATDGHSFRVTAASGGGVATKHKFLMVNNGLQTYVASDPKTCPAPYQITPAGCQIASDCTVSPGENSCGTLVNKLVPGKTFLVQFWAKGSGKLHVGFTKAPVGSGQPSAVSKLTASGGIELDGTWRVYELGPFDSGTVADFDEDTILYFNTTSGNTFYLDNILLKQVDENVTLIKDSWVVPSTCDTAPNGLASPQYYLGCEAYRDQKGQEDNFYQFTSLCSEKVVGCEEFYQTHESDSPYSQVFNARCVQGTKTTYQGKSTVDLNPKLPINVSTATACIVGSLSSKPLCTIKPGSSYCTFNYDGTFGEVPPLDPASGFGVILGPEAEIVPADGSVYLVDNGQANCSAAGAGCQEVGKPTYNQDLTKVSKFESVYIINDPDTYADVLCSNQALFCDEFNSTASGNYYFKNPNGKTCEYKANVEFNGAKYSGWFRTGVDEPCYWEDTNKNGKFNPASDSAYVIAGDQMAIWKNGDKDYKGWVGACASQYDLCTEFVDVVDTEGGLKKDGTSYFYLNNAELNVTSAITSDACNGKVSQKEGCAVFNNRSHPELTYNASASYVLSVHADKLLKKEPNAFVDPVSCDGDGGVFTDTDGNVNNLCAQRCEYTVESGDALVTNMSTQIGQTDFYFERSCYDNTDCPSLKTKGDKLVKGGCAYDLSPQQQLKNDANTVLEVNRDRSCSAWIACESGRTSFNARTNKYEPICDSINLCVRGKSIGLESVCTDWDARAPEILTDLAYSKRDTTWNGFEMTGYAIPNQLPVELYDQFNVNPPMSCVGDAKILNKNGTPLSKEGIPESCETKEDCKKGSCVSIKPDYRLVYVAGSCDSKTSNGQQCEVGHCSLSGGSCSTKQECSQGAQDKCVIGFCQATVTATNGVCPSGYIYSSTKDACVDVNLGDQPCYAGSSNGCTGDQVCVPSASTTVGTCYNDKCVSDIRDTTGDGQADAFTNGALEQSCRGYPEADSPYPARVVDLWVSPTQKIPQSSPEDQFATPYSYIPGYQNSNVCAPNFKGESVDCLCSYDRVGYGDGAITRFEEVSTDVQIEGICLGGPNQGLKCDSDQDCADKGAEEGLNSASNGGGTCLRLTSQDTIYGWKGYCIEKDSSIQLYSSGADADQACLTWLPVDQLTGATDLYAKYVTAGYKPQDTFYCAETKVAYNIVVSGSGGGGTEDDCGVDCYCAETEGTSGGNGCEDSLEYDDFIQDEPFTTMGCRDGFFAVMSGCGDASPGGLCCSDLGCDVVDASGDDNWPYMCIPYLSYKTQDDDEGKIGDPCQIPDKPSLTYKHGNVMIYLLDKDTWTQKREFYNDCKVQGLLAPTAGYSNQAFDKYFVRGDEKPKVAYAALEAYPVCKSVVQVSRKDDGTDLADEGEFNVAWTNRVWQDSLYTLKGLSGNNLSDFGYTASTELPFYGQAYAPTEQVSGDKGKDVYPHRISACFDEFGIIGTKALPSKANNSCESGYKEDAYNDARAFNASTYNLKEGTVTSTEALSIAANRLQQLFAKSYQILTFDDQAFYNDSAQDGKFASFGSFESKTHSVSQTYDSTQPSGVWEWGEDVRMEGDGLEKPTPPVVYSLGPCFGTKCREGRLDAITVNDQDQGDVIGTGVKKVSVSFFTAANSNQLPIRQIVLDWGDGELGGTDPLPWPTSKQSGSTAKDNFYQNQRGLNNEGNEICGSKDDDFGFSAEACSSSYVVFSGDYSCSAAKLNQLKANELHSTCDYAPDGRLLNSPCTDGQRCIYQPRVHIKDNWGWCTGICNAGKDKTDGCFEGEGNKNNECRIKECPSEGVSTQCPDKHKSNSVVNPWVNYDGFIIIEPE